MTQRICSVEGCGRPVRSKGLCTTHRYRLDNGLPLDTPIRQYETGERRCKVLGCDQKRGSDGTYCPMHLARFKKTGEVGEAARRRMAPGEAVWEKPNHRRRHVLAKKYGITPEEYAKLFDSQGRCCAICKAIEPGGKHRNSTNRSDWNWAVDHDHESGRVRGLLCERCNRALGLFGDDIQILVSAAHYLAR